MCCKQEEEDHGFVRYVHIKKLKLPNNCPYKILINKCKKYN